MIDVGTGPARARARHPGPLGVDAPGGGGAGPALPRDHLLARRRADERPSRSTPRRRIRQLRRRRSIACSMDADVGARPRLRRVVRRPDRAALRGTPAAARARRSCSPRRLAPALHAGRPRALLRARAAAAGPLFVRRRRGAGAPRSHGGTARLARRDCVLRSARHCASCSAPASPRLMRGGCGCSRACDFARDRAAVDRADARRHRRRRRSTGSVPVDHTREYCGCFRRPRAVTLDRTGHLGTVTQPGDVRRGRGGASSRRAGAEARRRTRATPAGARADAPRSAPSTSPGPLGRPRGRCLDEPALAARLARLRAAVVFAHPHPLHGGTMHTKVVYQGGQGAGARSAAPCCASTSAASAGAPAPFDNGAARSDDFRAALDFMAARYPGAATLGGRHLVRRVDRAHGRRARRSASSTLIGIAPPLHMYDFTP